VAKIRETLDFGNDEDLNIEKLKRIISDAYTDIAIAVNKKPDIYERDVDGVTTDTFTTNGDININTTSDLVEMVTNRSADGTTVTWTTLS
jgi:hypothetical protein